MLDAVRRKRSESVEADRSVAGRVGAGGVDAEFVAHLQGVRHLVLNDSAVGPFENFCTTPRQKPQVMS